MLYHGKIDPFGVEETEMKSAFFHLMVFGAVVYCQVPSAIRMIPPAGSGTFQSFTFKFYNSTGFQGISLVDLLINNGLDGRSACYVAISPVWSGGSTPVYLVNDNGDSGGPFASMSLPGSGTVQNSQCTVSAVGSSISGSGNELTVTLAIQFSSTFVGNKILYTWASNSLGVAPAKPIATWNVPATAASGPGVSGMSPRQGVTASGTFSYVFTDSNGLSDVQVLDVLINDALDGRHACYIAFIPSGASGGAVYLVNNAGDSGGPFVSYTLGTNGSALTISVPSAGDHSPQPA